MSELQWKPLGEIAAIYVRKSNEQRGVSADATSIARQLDHARQFAAAKGWTVPDAYVFVDDGVSGGEINTRPDLVRLRTTAGKSAPFQHLIVPDLDRLGRESVGTSMVMKDLDEANVQIWEYMRGERVALDSPTDVLVMQVRNYANAMQRASIRMHVLDKLTRNAKAGYSTGGRTYGYTSQVVNGPDGKRSHAVKVIDEPQAAIVRRIFARAAAGAGGHRIARELSADGIPPPKGRGDWNPASVDGILQNPLYKGVGVFGRVQHKNKWGSVKFTRKPASEWLITQAAGPAIVSVEVWDRVAALRAARDAKRKAAGPAGGRQRDGESPYLLTGYARCGHCGAPFSTRTLRAPRGGSRYPVYGCYAYHKIGRRKCTNASHVRYEIVDRAVLAGITEALARRFDPAAIAAEFVAESTRRQSTGGAARLRAEITRIERERDRYADAVGKAGNLDALIARLDEREHRLTALRAELDALTTPRGRVALPPANVLAKKIADELRTFRATLGGTEMGAVRAALRDVLDGPLSVRALPRVEPKTRRDQTNTRRFEITGTIRGDRLLRAVVGEVPRLTAPG